MAEQAVHKLGKHFESDRQKTEVLETSRGIYRPRLPTCPLTSDHPLKEPQALSSPLQGRPEAGLEVKCTDSTHPTPAPHCLGFALTCPRTLRMFPL